MSVWGYLLFTAWATAAALLMGGWQLVGLAGLELVFGLVWSRSGLGLLRRPRFWILVLTPVAVSPFLVGAPDGSLGPFSLSQEGLITGLAMAARAFILTLAVRLGVASLSLSDMVALFDRFGLRGVGFSLALAVNLVGVLQEMVAVAGQTILLRGGARRPWLALRLFLVTTIANTVRYGDEVVAAAAVRGFDPSGERGGSVPLRRWDLGLAAGLSICSLLFLFGL